MAPALDRQTDSQKSHINIARLCADDKQPQNVIFRLFVQKTSVNGFH